MFYYAYECKSGMAVYNESIHEYVSTNTHLKVLGPIRSNVALVQMVQIIKQEEVHIAE